MERDLWIGSWMLSARCQAPNQCHHSKTLWATVSTLIHQEPSGKRSYWEAAWGIIFRITRFTSVISSNFFLSVAISWHADKVVYYKHSRLSTGGENVMTSRSRNRNTRVALILSSLCSILISISAFPGNFFLRNLYKSCSWKYLLLDWFCGAIYLRKYHT